MDISKIDLSKVENESMIPVYLVIRIYDFNNYYIENNEMEFDRLTVNEDILDIIDSINFVYSKKSEDETEIHKVGFLRNFEVYLDPNKKDNTIIFENQNKDKAILEVIHNYKP
jgi:hypothetical protein